MRVVLLGAGASKSYGQSPTGCRMPIARDFLPTYNQLDISKSTWVLVGDILNYVRDHYGIDPRAFNTATIDIEELHSHVEAQLQRLNLETRAGNRGPEHIAEHIHTFKAYNNLVFLFASVINEIQNGPISTSHAKLSNALKDDDVVITFNWDCLLDRALHATGRWRVETGYDLPVHMVFRDGWKPSGVTEISVPQLLKLHGSSNWLTSAPVQIPGQEVRLLQRAPSNRLYVYEFGSKPYPTFAGRYMGGYQPFSFGYYPPNILDDEGLSPPRGHTFIRTRLKFPWVPEGTTEESGLPTIPLIIPPVKNKMYDFYGTLFSKLWASAQTAISGAESILVIGYSFPPTDLRSRAIFTQAFMKRSTLPRVTIIDPLPERAADVFRLELGVPSSHLTVRDEYWSDKTDVNSLLI